MALTKEEQKSYSSAGDKWLDFWEILIQMKDNAVVMARRGYDIVDYRFYVLILRVCTSVPACASSRVSNFDLWHGTCFSICPSSGVWNVQFLFHLTTCHFFPLPSRKGEWLLAVAFVRCTPLDGLLRFASMVTTRLALASALRAQARPAIQIHFFLYPMTTTVKYVRLPVAGSIS